MSFHFLIDGYNLLYALPNIPPGSLQAKREALLKLIKTKRPHGNNAATVVFDSREGSGSRHPQGDLTIVFTAGETADDWISAKVRHTAQPRTLVVVSNDQGIHRDIKGTGAKFVTADDYWKKSMKEAPSARPSTRVEDDAITEELRIKWIRD